MQEKIDNSRILLLLKRLVLSRFGQDPLNTEEEAELNEWASSSSQNQKLLSEASSMGAIESAITKRSKILARVPNAIERFTNTETHRRKTGLIWLRFIAAVAASVLGVFALFHLLHPKLEIKSPVASKEAILRDIPPGCLKATLTLGNGQTIQLDSIHTGTIAYLGTTKIQQSKYGELLYKQGDQNGNAVSFNTVTTPPGGTYRLILSDGSRIWLNSSSSLRFASNFKGSQREVELTGEGYFEIARNKEKPFLVKTKRSTVTVLGTAFDIMAYDDEPTSRTALIEGSVKVSTSNTNTTLKAGQEAQIGSGSQISISPVLTNQVLAWKSGIFFFEYTPLQNAMRQISRWYNVDIKYNGPIPQTTILGNAPMNTNLSTILKLLKEEKINCHLEGKTIIINP